MIFSSQSCWCFMPWNMHMVADRFTPFIWILHTACIMSPYLYVHTCLQNKIAAFLVFELALLGFRDASHEGVNRVKWFWFVFCNFLFCTLHLLPSIFSFSILLSHFSSSADLVQIPTSLSTGCYDWQLCWTTLWDLHGKLVLLAIYFQSY